MFERPPDSYLRKKIESSRSEEEKGRYTKEDLGHGDLFDHDEFYSESVGVFQETLGKTEVLFSYSKPTKQEILQSLYKDNEAKESIPTLVLDDIRRVDRLDMKNDNAHFSLPSSKRFWPAIYFNVQLVEGSGFSHSANSVFLEEDPLSRKGLLILFHELGHFERSTIRSKTEQEEYEAALRKSKSLIMSMLPFGKLTEKQAGVILKEERDAWAFALRTLRPFEQDLDLNLNKALDTIHIHSLQSYSDEIRDELKIKI